MKIIDVKEIESELLISTLATFTLDGDNVRAEYFKESIAQGIPDMNDKKRPVVKPKDGKRFFDTLPIVFSGVATRAVLKV